MSIIPRKNSTNSYYKVIYDDKQDLKKGVYLFEEIEDTKTGGTYTKITMVSTLIYIDEKIKSETAIFYKVNFHDNNEHIFKYIKASDILIDGYKDSDDFKFIINNGLIISYKCKPLVIDYLKCSVEYLDTKKGTEKSGWNETNEYIGNGLNTSNIVFTGTTTAKFETKGSKDQYYSKLRTIFQENPLVFSIVSYCASGFILHYLRNEINQILAITGISSKGKSTVGKLALSMFTHPRYFRGMDATKYGMSLLAKNHKDNFVFFDENQESNLTPEQRLQFIYSLANASERLKATKFGDNYNVKDQEEQPKYSILIAGEKSFLNGVNKSGTGLDARFLEIVLPETIPLWDSINSSEDAEGLNQFILDHHGHIAEPFINYIKENYKSIQPNYESALKAIRAELNEPSAIIQRKARILAYTFITSRILASILYGDDISNEIADMSYQALKRALFTEQEETKVDIFKEKLSHIEQTEYNYFEITNKLNSELNNEKRFIKDYFGFININNQSKQIAIISTKLSDFCHKMGFDEKLFIMWAKENDLLKTEKNSNTKLVMINKQRARYYFLDISNDFFNSVSNNEEQLQDELEDIVPPWD